MNYQLFDETVLQQRFYKRLTSIYVLLHWNVVDTHRIQFSLGSGQGSLGTVGPPVARAWYPSKMATEVANFRIRAVRIECTRDCVYIEGLSVDVEEGKEALGKLLSGVMGSGSCVASCPPSVILHLSPANTRTISQLSTRASLHYPPIHAIFPFPPLLSPISRKRELYSTYHVSARCEKNRGMKREQGVRWLFSNRELIIVILIIFFRVIVSFSFRYRVREDKVFERIKEGKRNGTKDHRIFAEELWFWYSKRMPFNPSTIK